MIVPFVRYDLTCSAPRCCTDGENLRVRRRRARRYLPLSSRRWSAHASHYMTPASMVKARQAHGQRKCTTVVPSRFFAPLGQDRGSPNHSFRVVRSRMPVILRARAAQIRRRDRESFWARAFRGPLFSIAAPPFAVVAPTRNLDGATARECSRDFEHTVCEGEPFALADAGCGHGTHAARSRHRRGPPRLGRSGAATTSRTVRASKARRRGPAPVGPQWARFVPLRWVRLRRRRFRSRRSAFIFGLCRVRLG